MGPFCLMKTVFLQSSIEKANQIINDDFNLSEELSTFFEDVVRSVNVKPDEYYLSDTEILNDLVKIAITKFENHLRV